MNEQLQAIGCAIDHIEEHLQEEITVADVAVAAGYSLYHFIRVFSQTVLHTPYNYLIRRRLSQAALELVQTDRRIIDIAVDYCFNSPEVFSRAFLRMFGEPPSKYRQRGFTDSKYLFPTRTLAHLEYLQTNQVLPPTFAECEAFQVTGLMTRIGPDGGGIDQLWETLVEIISNENNTSPCKYFGVITYPEDWMKFGVFYMAGVAECHPENPALVNKVLPAGGFACFNHTGSFATVQFLRAEIYQTWLPKSGKQIATPMEIEMFGTQGYSPDCPRQIYIPICDT